MFSRVNSKVTVKVRDHKRQALRASNFTLKVRRNAKKTSVELETMVVCILKEGENIVAVEVELEENSSSLRK
jgi:acyl-CoA thioesterase FadM